MGIGCWEVQRAGTSDDGRRPEERGYTVSGLGAAVPEQGEHQSNADRQCAEAEDEQGEAAESRKRPEASPRDDTKERWGT